MSLTLSSADTGRLHQVNRLLLAPLDTPSETWDYAVVTSLRELLGADKATMSYPCGDVLHVVNEGVDPAALTLCFDRYRKLTEAKSCRRELNVEVWNCAMLYDPAQFHRTEFYNDFLPPFGLFDGLAMAVDPGQGAEYPRVAFFHDSPRAKPFGERGLAILRFLLPSFKVGVGIQARYTAGRARLLRLGERFRLTPREGMVARLLALGRSNTAIATELGITERTARAHTEKVLCKLGVNSRAEVGFRVLAGEREGGGSYLPRLRPARMQSLPWRDLKLKDTPPAW